MLAPSASGWPIVTVCPETHPLARLVESASAKPPPADPSAMDHASMDHASMGHGVSGGDGGHGGGDDSNSSAGQTKDCAFAGGVKFATGPIDAALLAAVIAFALLLGIAPIRPIFVSNRPYLRPPLRGPPVLV